MVLLSVVDRMLTGSASENCRERESAECTDFCKLLLLTRATILVLPLTVNVLVAIMFHCLTYLSLVWWYLDGHFETLIQIMDTYKPAQSSHEMDRAVHHLRKYLLS